MSILFLSFGLFSSINQGITVVLGHWDGSPYGAEIIILSDIPMFLILFLIKPKRPKKNRTFFMFLNFFVFIYYLISQIGWIIAKNNVVFAFGMVHLTRAMILYYVLSTRLVRIDYIANFIKGLSIGLIFQTLVGVWQWQIGPAYLPFYKIVNTGWRSTGTMVDPNVFGVFLLTMLPFAWRISIFLRWKPRLLYFGITLSGFASLFASYSRGAWLSFVFSNIVFLFIDFKKGLLTKKYFGMIIVMTIILFLGFLKYQDVIFDRFSNVEEAVSGKSTSSRMFLIKDALRIINEHKVLGVGLNQYRFYASETTQGLKMVHNAYLLVTAEQGIFGGILFILIFFSPFFRGFKLLNTKNKIIYNTASATLIAILSFTIYNLGAPDYHVPEITWHSWKLVGIINGLLVCSESLKQKPKLIVKKIIKNV